MMQDNSVQSYIEELEVTVTNLTRLLEVNNVLNNALLTEGSRIDSLLTYLMDAAAKITDAEAASVLLWNEPTQELYFEATTTDNESAGSLIGKPVPLDSIAGTIFRERRMVEVSDAAEDPRHYSGVDKEIKFQTRSLLGVPMIAKGKPIGVLEVVNKRSLPWTIADRSNLSVLAAEAAVAIEVANMVTRIQRVNDELSELDKLKNDFIAIASHELRTPLGIILGYASFLQDAQDESVSEHAGKVLASALQLRRIIEDMINLRYLKQKPDDLHREVISLTTILEDLQRDILSSTDSEKHHLSFINEAHGLRVNVDRSRISMALTNILNNAVSFSPDGGNITVLAKQRDDQTVWISIQDEGIGLEEDKFERIFEEFYQVEDHMIRHVGGLGIGLSITRALVEVHDGRVWVESEGLGAGSTFIVALPIVQG